MQKARPPSEPSATAGFNVVARSQTGTAGAVELFLQRHTAAGLEGPSRSKWIATKSRFRHGSRRLLSPTDMRELIARLPTGPLCRCPSELWSYEVAGGSTGTIT